MSRSSSQELKKANENLHNQSQKLFKEIVAEYVHKKLINMLEYSKIKSIQDKDNSHIDKLKLILENINCDNNFEFILQQVYPIKSKASQQKQREAQKQLDNIIELNNVVRNNIITKHDIINASDAENKYYGNELYITLKNLMIIEKIDNCDDDKLKLKISLFVRDEIELFIKREFPINHNIKNIQTHNLKDYKNNSGCVIL